MLAFPRCTVCVACVHIVSGFTRDISLKSMLLPLKNLELQPANSKDD